MLGQRVTPGVHRSAAPLRTWQQPVNSSSSRRRTKVHVGVEVSARVQQDDGLAALSGRVRLVRGMEEMQQVARLRAEAYYEDDRSRFVESFKKKFAAGEADSLEQRTAPLPSTGVPIAECLVALDVNAEGATEGHEEGYDEGHDDAEESRPSTSSRVVGCIDIRLPRAASGRHPVGVPEDDATSSYILNVVVEEELRGQGIGKMLMKAAMQRALTKWSSERLYTHVAADNEVALKLYTGCGFKEFSVDAEALQGGSVLGKLLLLCAKAEDVPRD